MNKRKSILTQDCELLRHPFLHNLIFACIGHLTLKHRPLVDRDLWDEGERGDQLLGGASG